MLKLWVRKYLKFYDEKNVFILTYFTHVYREYLIQSTHLELDRDLKMYIVKCIEIIWRILH